MIITIAVILILSGVVLGLMAYNRIQPIGLGMHKSVYQTNNVALEGYDATSYFTGNLEKGSPVFSTSYQDIHWNFSCEENLLKFKENPARFIPQYGGYCAKAVSTGFVAPSDPTVYTLHKNKLFLFSSEEVKDNFLKDPNSMIAACEKKWKQ